MNGFNIIETTADIGIEASGINEAELVKNALKGFYFICFDKFPNILEATKEFKLTFDFLEELVFCLLEESIYELYTKKLLIQIKSIKKVNNLYEVIYEKVKTDDQVQIEIKGVTKHNFRVFCIDGIYRVRVIFDI